MDEWIGSSPDAKIPDRVKARVFERYGGRCYLSGIKIGPGMAWEVEHVLALAAGGEHRESNLAPVLAKAHKEKTREDRKVIAKINRVRKKHLGLKRSGRPMPGSRRSKWRRKLDGRTVLR